MFQDIDLSKELNEKYKGFMEENTQLSNSIDFSIQVLSSGSWSFTQNAPFTLPRNKNNDNLLQILSIFFQLQLLICNGDVNHLQPESVISMYTGFKR